MLHPRDRLRVLSIAMLALAVAIGLSIAAGFFGRHRPELWLAAAFQHAIALLLAVASKAA